MNKKGMLVAFLSLFFLTQMNAVAQKRSKEQKEMVVYGQEAPTYIDINKILQFENVNKIPFFYDEKALKKIEKLEKSKEWEELRVELAFYIAQFGIQNFYKNTEMIWRFAKLTELYGDKDNAMRMYKLVLNHHRDDIDLKTFEIYYDSISNNYEKYVPVDYYYQLVDYRKNIDTIRPPRGWKVNMGHMINSEVSDYGPALASNDQLMIFTSNRHRIRAGLDDISNEDVFYSEKDDEDWDEVKPFKDLKSIFNEGSVCFSKDGKTLFFSRCDAPDTYGNCDLFSAQLMEDSTWGNIMNLGIDVNSISWDSHPSLSHNEDTLYFASDRIGGFGLSDIYFTYKNERGEWQKAQNLGPIINTRNNEVSPFYHPRFRVLYFSSNGHKPNFGEFDIYKAYKDSLMWEEPINIGPLVNGPGSEFYFTIDRDSKYLYYSMSIENDMENLDLYSFPLPMEGQPDATTSLYGSLMDSESGNPFERGIVSIIDLDNGIEVAPQNLSPDGTFEFNLINKTNYLLIIQGDEFFRIEEIFYLDGDMEINKIAEPITSKLKFESIEFENGSSELKPEMFADLDRVANFLLDNPDFRLIISGHTDGDGSQDFNKELSEQRANSILEYINYFGGVPEPRLQAIGYGSSKPIVIEKTEEDKALNRRVEFELYRPGKEELDRIHEQQKDQEEKFTDDWN